MFKTIKSNFVRLWASGAIHIVFGSFATKFVAFFGSIFVVRFLTKSDYGILSYIENIYGYAFIFAGYGMINAILRFIIIAPANKKKTYYHRIIRNSICFDTLLAIVLITANMFISYPKEFAQASQLMPILALLIPFQNLVNILLTYLRAIFKNKLYAYGSCSVSVLLIIGRIIGALVSGVTGVVFSRLILNILLSLIGLILVARFFVHEYGNEPLTKSEKREMDKYAIQYMLTNGLWALFMLNDTFLLAQFVGSSNVLADYKVAYVLPGNISIFATAIGTYIGPQFTKNEKNIAWVKANFKKTLLISSGVMLSVCLIITMVSNPIIKLMYGEQYLNVIPLMELLLVAAFLNSAIRYTIANILGAIGKISNNLVVSIFGMVLQIVLDCLLIPNYGAYGAAVASIIVYLSMSIMLLIVFRKVTTSPSHL